MAGTDGGHGRTQQAVIYLDGVQRSRRPVLWRLTRFQRPRLAPSPGPKAGTLILLVYFTYDDIPDNYEGCSEPFIAAVRTEQEAESLLSSAMLNGHTGTVDWETHYLQGPDAPYASWPDVDVVHVVSEGGIGNSEGNTGHDPVGLGVFIDLPGAEAFARRHNNPAVVVRTVPVGVLLPIQE